uniref:ANK_REP_REGION domain-containing protein n=1 Tax=Parastrongyloides trichosuri TaxID=131310 RepID=A0A0N4ZFV9_PARTI
MSSQPNSNTMTLSAVSLHNLASQNNEFALVNVKMLVEKYGRNVCERRESDGMTALHLAAMSDNLPMVKLLIHLGADYNNLDNFGRTPLTLAAGKSFIYLRNLHEKDGKENQENSDKKKNGKFRFIKKLIPSFGDKNFNPVKGTQKKIKKLFSKTGGSSLSIDDGVHLNESLSNNINQGTGDNDETKDKNKDKKKVEDYYTPIVKKQPPFNPNYKNNYPTINLETPPPKPPRKDYYESIDDVKNGSYNPGETPTNTKMKEGSLDITELCEKLEKTPFFKEDKKPKCIVKYSKTLNKFIHLEDEKMLSEGNKLDRKLKDEMNSLNTPTKKNKSPNYFNYLLLDPTKVKESDLLSFIEAIFYVGKGTNARPKAHFIETLRKREEGDVNCDKTKMISKLWDNGLGIISLQINQNIIEAEALCREAAIIEAIQISNLTNKKKGDYHGDAGTWNKIEKELLGCVCLKKAFQMWQIDPPRHIFESDFIPK